MGPKLEIERIEVVRSHVYQIDMREEESGKLVRTFITKEALFALICVAEKEERQCDGIEARFNNEEIKKDEEAGTN